MYPGKCRFGKYCALAKVKSDTNQKVKELESEANLLKPKVQILKNNLLNSENEL